MRVTSPGCTPARELSLTPKGSITRFFVRLFFLFRALRLRFPALSRGIFRSAAHRFVRSRGRETLLLCLESDSERQTGGATLVSYLFIYTSRSLSPIDLIRFRFVRGVSPTATLSWIRIINIFRSSSEACRVRFLRPTWRES